MAEVIQNPSSFASGLLSRFGIPRLTRWILSDQVVPVAVVDAASVTLAATVTPTLQGTPASAGVLVAPGAGSVLADTGALAAGNYTLVIALSCAEIVAAGNASSIQFDFQRRDAANAANVWAQRRNIMGSIFETWRVTLAATERFRITNVAAGTAGISYQASIWAIAS